MCTLAHVCGFFSISLSIFYPLTRHTSCIPLEWQTQQIWWCLHVYQHIIYLVWAVMAWQTYGNRNHHIFPFYYTMPWIFFFYVNLRRRIRLPMQATCHKFHWKFSSYKFWSGYQDRQSSMWSKLRFDALLLCAWRLCSKKVISMRTIELSHMPCLIYIDIACRCPSPHVCVLSCVLGQHWPIAQKLKYANFHLIQFSIFFFALHLLLLLPHHHLLDFVHSQITIFSRSFGFMVLWAVFIVAAPLKSRSILMTRTVSSTRFVHTILTVTDLYFVLFSFIPIHSFGNWIVLGKADVVGTMPLVLMVKRGSRASR